MVFDLLSLFFFLLRDSTSDRKQLHSQGLAKGYISENIVTIQAADAKLRDTI